MPPYSCLEFTLHKLHATTHGQRLPIWYPREFEYFGQILPKPIYIIQALVRFRTIRENIHVYVYHILHMHMYMSYYSCLFGNTSVQNLNEVQGKSAKREDICTACALVPEALFNSYPLSWLSIHLHLTVMVHAVCVWMNRGIC